MLFLNSDDVAQLVTMSDVISSVEEAYRQLGTGEAADVPRETVTSTSTDGNLKVLPAAGPAGLGGYVYSGGYGDRPSETFWNLAFVFDDEWGGLRCVIENDRLSWLRTGATSGVATAHCAREDASVLGVIGSGREARAQLLAVAEVREIVEVRVYSRTPEHRESFATQMSEVTDKTVVAVETAREAVSECDVVCTATTSPEPVLAGDWIDPGAHINAIGSHYPEQREIDTRTIERSRVIVDSLARAKKEEGELLIPAAEGAFEWEQATELGDVVTGGAIGREDSEQITFMTSGGISNELLVPARDVYERAVERNVGTQLSIDVRPPL